PPPARRLAAGQTGPLPRPWPLPPSSPSSHSPPGIARGSLRSGGRETSKLTSTRSPFRASLGCEVGAGDRRFPSARHGRALVDAVTELPCSELSGWVKTVGDAAPTGDGWETVLVVGAEWVPQAARDTGMIIVNASRSYILVVTPATDAGSGATACGCGIAFAVEPRHGGWMRPPLIAKIR